jgi:hypothetical protein
MSVRLRLLLLAVMFASAGMIAGFLSSVFPSPDRPAPRQSDRIAEQIVARARGFADGFVSACGEPCFLSDNFGGRISDFLAVARRIVAERRHLVIAIVGVGHWCPGCGRRGWPLPPSAPAPAALKAATALQKPNDKQK